MYLIIIIYSVIHFMHHSITEGEGGRGAFRFALARPTVCPSDFFNFMTKMENWGHPCPMNTL